MNMMVSKNLQATVIHIKFIYICIVNIEPNKTTIYFHNKQLIYNLVDKMVDTIYPTKIDAFFNKQNQSAL
jgi:DNA mismatch repair ATPase MutL